MFKPNSKVTTSKGLVATFLTSYYAVQDIDRTQLLTFRTQEEAEYFAKQSPDFKVVHVADVLIGQKTVTVETKFLYPFEDSVTVKLITASQEFSKVCKRGKVSVMKLIKELGITEPVTEIIVI